MKTLTILILTVTAAMADPIVATFADLPAGTKISGSDGTTYRVREFDTPVQPIKQIVGNDGSFYRVKETTTGTVISGNNASGEYVRYRISQ